jgi:hemerythrin
MTDNKGPAVVSGLADIEAEHAMQYQLLGEAEQHFGAGEFAPAREAVRQLYDFTEAHFGSEQVLMRQYSYPGYEAHEREHGELLLALRHMHAQMELEKPGPATDASSIRRWLSTHIQHSDRAFLEFLASSTSAAAG